MKVKVSQLVGSSEPLGKLMTQPMPSATAFRCAKTLKAVQAELESYDEARKNLIEQHGADGEIKPKDKGWDKFIGGDIGWNRHIDCRTNRMVNDNHSWRR